MRKIQLLATLAVVMMASAFTWFVQPQEKFIVLLTDSKVHWLAKKVTGQHEGDVLLKSGEVTMDKKKLKSGSFEIDMNSITCTDIKDAGTNKKLLGHLKSSDFFSVEKHKTASLIITSAKAIEGTSMMAEMADDKSEGYEVVANLTIKEKTAPVTFKVYVLQTGKTVTAKAKLTFDRTKYDIQYGSASFFEGLGDRAIYNDVELTINVTAKTK